MLGPLAWLIKDPIRWNVDFHVDDLMKGPNFLMKTCAMSHIDFARHLPASLAFLSVVINMGIYLLWAFIHVHLTLLFILDITKADATIDRVTNGITMTIIHSFGFFTISYYQYNRHKYLRIVDFMNTKFVPRSAVGLTFTTSERSYLTANRFTFIWTALCIVGTVQWAVWPLFSSTRALPINVNYIILDQTVNGGRMCVIKMIRYSQAIYSIY